jgi:hypothetical protein
MRTSWSVALFAAVSLSCASVKVAQRNGCWVRTTQSFPGITREEVGPCDRAPPQWSSDRVARLVQECMAEADYRWQTQAIALWTKGQPLPAQQSEESVMQACMGQVATSVVGENEALKKRVAELDTDRTRLAAVADEEREHLRQAEDRMTDALGEAAKKPSQAAYAAATSSGSAATRSDQKAAQADQMAVLSDPSFAAPLPARSPLVKREPGLPKCVSDPHQVRDGAPACIPPKHDAPTWDPPNSGH